MPGLPRSVPQAKKTYDTSKRGPRKARKACEWCGKKCIIATSSKRFCSRPCWFAWHRGENHQQHTKIEIACDWCGKNFSRNPFEVAKVARHYCSQDCASKAHSLTMRGLTDGEPIAAKKYALSSWFKVRKIVIERDRGCVQCGMTEEEHRKKYGASISVDHIVAVREGGSDEPSNLQCLCRSCHARKTNAGG